MSIYAIQAECPSILNQNRQLPASKLPTEEETTKWKLRKSVQASEVWCWFGSPGITGRPGEHRCEEAAQQQ